MATFFLIHGAWQGAWVWQKLTPLIEAAGHAAVAVDLPGDGHDDTPPQTVTTMLIAEKVAALIDQVDGPVIVLGHSMGRDRGVSGQRIAPRTRLRRGLSLRFPVAKWAVLYRFL